MTTFLLIMERLGDLSMAAWGLLCLWAALGGEG